MVTQSLGTNPRFSVFVVDDSADILDLFGLLAEINGFVLVCARDGFEGLEKLAQVETDPAVLLVDLKMPTMDGREFVRRIQKYGLAKSSRIVVFSAEERNSVEKLDPSIEWLNKPFSVTDVMKVINMSRPH